MKKIGLMGGTFNPIHNAHLMLARNAYKQFGLDEVVFLPSKKAPHKPNINVASDDARVEMIQLAIEGINEFSLLTSELERDGTTYTVDTLEEIVARDGEDELYFIIGGDSLFSFHEWRNPKRILELCALIACGRDNRQEIEILQRIEELKSIYGGEILYMHMEDMNISSSHIRKLVGEKASVSNYIPRKVEDYIYNNKLY